jgi:hypothetical protein
MASRTALNWHLAAKISFAEFSRFFQKFPLLFQGKFLKIRAWGKMAFLPIDCPIFSGEKEMTMKKNQFRPMVFLAGWLALSLAAAPMLPAQEGEAQDAGSGLEITRLVLCKKVENREPVDIVENFTLADQKAYCYMAVANPGEEQTLVFRWLFQDEEYFRFETRIGTSTNWRTSSMVTLRAGSWKVEIMHDEQVLQEIAFTVSE